MLVLSRKRGEQILVGQDIRITVVKLDSNAVRIGIEAPDGVMIYREELLANLLNDDSELPAMDRELALCAS